MKKTLIILQLMLLILSCGHTQKSVSGAEENKSVRLGPDFNADSAYAFCAAQCHFGPRVMNSEAHDRCGEWIAAQFRRFGMRVIEQKADFRGYDGTILHGTNIIASFKPEATDRVLLCAHWDSRPWADNDADSSNWRKPVLAANDGASGVAVLLELARLLQQADSLRIGVDFICFDAEDWGTPQWSKTGDDSDTWALGSHYWAAHPHVEGYDARYGILLDMVGGKGATFFREFQSMRSAAPIVQMVWSKARDLGYGKFFINADGGAITDDHQYVISGRGIPSIDIINYDPDTETGFASYWHTQKDNMDNIDRETLKAVGQTVLEVIYNQ